MYNCFYYYISCDISAEFIEPCFQDDMFMISKSELMSYFCGRLYGI